VVCNSSLLRTRKLCEDSFDERAGKVAGAVKTYPVHAPCPDEIISSCVRRRALEGELAAAPKSRRVVRWQVGVTLLTCPCSVLAGMAIVVIAFIKRA
jgi:hypothetical protein